MEMSARDRVPVFATLAKLLGGLLIMHGTEIRAAGPAVLERSFWVHASLGLFTQKNYFGPDFPATPVPTEQQVGNAARVLTGPCVANRLYLIYHRELPMDEARVVFRWWRRACPADVEIVPALVLRMYDKDRTEVFTDSDLAAWTGFFRDEIKSDRLALYEIADHRVRPEAQELLAGRFPGGLVRLGLQPGEALAAPFSSAVADTWSALCHGTRNDEDWRQPGFGAGTLRGWVQARNTGTVPVAWDLVCVAWDYTATARGGYPGYDDAEKNMPLPAGRNRAALRIISEAASPKMLAGFSSDLYILHENTRTGAHDGLRGSFYECLKRGEEYHGFFASPFQEITLLYREMKDQRRGDGL